MFAEAVVKWSHKLIRGYPPTAGAHWAAKAWDRSKYEVAPRVGPDLRAKKDRIGDLIAEYSKGADRIIEFACGTGTHTESSLKRSDVPEITLVDISADALEIVKKKFNNDPRLKTVHGDFWTDLGIGTADVVMCINAIHHIGDVRQVITRLTDYVNPGGVLIGTVLTMDNFHEFQRDVHGTIRHAARSAFFLANAVAMRLTSGKVRTHAYRSQLLYETQFESILRELAPGRILHLSNTRYISVFAIRC
jgi:trans-aconitate methyltransferase